MNDSELIMVSDVVKHLVDVIATYGDLPCVLEHCSVDSNNAILDPLVDVPVITIYKSGSTHVERCVMFANRVMEDHIESIYYTTE